ncbi:viral A-type inclusion protein [Reticulomyxa filosa]|uniref:Viral A-type inclusion protein n=1 Tax=Reticulomyxa filosa TaxID=46433 RepID=X6NBE6_RETFI|nr:viral A-type inclusion protein [Reticulomyxa filosa]|eukprot:ETO23094.1 viral A-type inclusion protein [Reticulomyxa filosa]
MWGKNTTCRWFECDNVGWDKEKWVNLDLLRKRIFCEAEACLANENDTKHWCAQMAKSMIHEFQNSCQMLEQYQTAINEKDKHIEHLHDTYDKICEMYSSLQNVIRQQKRDILFYQNKISESEKAIKKLEMSKTSTNSNKQKLQSEAAKLTEQLQLKTAMCTYDKELIQKLAKESEQQKQELETQSTKLTEQIQQQSEELDKKKLVFFVLSLMALKSTDIEKIRKREKLLVEKNLKWKEEALQAQANGNKMKELLKACQNECERIKQEKEKLMGDIRNKNVLIRALDEQTKPSVRSLFIDRAMTELTRTEAMTNRDTVANHNIDRAESNANLNNHRKSLKRSRHQMEDNKHQSEEESDKMQINRSNDDPNSNDHIGEERDPTFAPLKKKRNTKNNSTEHEHKRNNDAKAARTQRKSDNKDQQKEAEIQSNPKKKGKKLVRPKNEPLVACSPTPAKPSGATNNMKRKTHKNYPKPILE